MFGLDSFGGRSPFGRAAAEKIPRFPPRSPDISDAETSWEKSDDPVKDGGDGEEEEEEGVLETSA